MRPRPRKIVPRDKWSEMLARAKPEPLPASSPWLSSGHNLFLALCLTAGWVALEWTRGWLMSGFGWNGLGIALHGTWPLIQIAEFTGVAGVTFLVVFCNAILTTTARRIWEETRSRAMRPHFDLTLTLVGLVAVFVLGVSAVQTRPVSRPLHVALVQANVPRAEKFDIRYKQTIFDKFARLSKIALASTSNVDLLVWPESAMPAPVLEDQETFDFVSQIASSNRLIYCSARSRKDGIRSTTPLCWFRPKTNHNFTAKFTSCRLANLCRSAILSHSSRKLWVTRFRKISTPAQISPFFSSRIIAGRSRR
jgi:hypothetical protein